MSFGPIFFFGPWTKLKFKALACIFWPGFAILGLFSARAGQFRPVFGPFLARPGLFRATRINAKRPNQPSYPPPMEKAQIYGFGKPFSARFCHFRAVFDPARTLLARPDQLWARPDNLAARPGHYRPGPFLP